jgi:ABC-type polysaccharide/polyol phosphate transport system ATPase subunit
MSETTAVSVHDVSKKYRLYNSPQERFLEALHPFKKKYHREFWALKNVSFEVPKGRTVGIIGRNGSGKSTLLQIICSVLKPTSGEVKVNGRISSLLELGGGFNPEFTGRENVFMNGQIAGFSATQMKKRLPKIEAFADIGEFIDQPVKTYSSGMFVRLAFAAAINIDPDILIIDEALAVGDAKFQHKCYGKFLEFQKVGKTIIFVTHNTDAVVKHCDSAVLLERGEIIEIGEPKLITNYYIDLLFTGKVSNYQLSPLLVEESHRCFNIVHYKTKYYAVLQSLGSIDFRRLDDNYLEVLVKEKKCIVGISLEEVKQLINQIVPQDSASLTQHTETTSVRPRTAELDKFLEEIVTADNCINKKSYNKNEYRFGDKRAVIIDYFIVSKENCDPAIIQSGEIIDIYLKARFLRAVKFPLFGFSIKTIDGIVIYASNTRYSNISIAPAKEFETITFKFSMKLDLHPGDFFIDLGIAEKLPNIDEPIDIRYALIHLVVQAKDYIFDGFSDFSSTFAEVARISESVSMKG